MHPSRLLPTLCFLLVFLTFVLPGGVTAQEKKDDVKKEEPKVRALEVRHTLSGQTVVIPKSDGWVIGKAPKGAIALLRLAGDASDAQIEIRVTPEIKEEDSERHFRTLHTNLKRQGLKRLGEPKEVVLSEVFGKAVETEYTLSSGGKPYRLVFWHFYHPTGVWFISGFFPEGDREARYAVMQDVAKKIAVEAKK